MSAKQEFLTAVKEWLSQNNFSNAEVDIKDDFFYDITTQTINIGIYQYEDADEWFEEFLVENGCNYVGILAPVLSFLHELGHYNTIDKFSEFELMFHYMLKEDPVKDEMDPKEWIFTYWCIPDEFAANEWEVKYINSHIEQVECLGEIFMTYWNEMVEEVLS